ncbi:hypothetical protein [Parvimonas micra]|jgi:hypothetical protein
MEKIKSKWNELNDFAERSNDNFTGWCKDKINYNIIFYVIQFLMVVIGVFTFYKYKSDFGDYIYIYLLNLFSSIILIKFEYYKLRFFDLLFNALFIVAYIILQICTFITIDTLFIVYFFYKIIICILLCIISNDKIKNWLKNSSNRKVYITANMFYCIMLFIYYYVYENNLTLYNFLVYLILYFSIQIFSLIIDCFYKLRFFDFVVNIFFGTIILSILIFKFLCIKIFNIQDLIYFVRFRSLIIESMNIAKITEIFVFIIIYIMNLVINKNLNKDFKVNDWFRWFDNANLLHIDKFENIGIRFQIRETLARENRDKSKFLERKILLRFKDKSEIEREKFILSRISGFWCYYVIIPILVSISAIIVTDVFFEKQISIKFIKDIFGKFNTITINKFMSLIKDNLIYIPIFVYILLFVLSLYQYIKFVQDKNKYLQLLNYISNNYENLCKEHNIKRIFITMNLNKKFKTTKKHLNYAIFNYDKIIKSNNFKPNEFRKFLEFLENNGIEICIYSRENKENRIKKHLKYNELDDFEFIIIDKKEISNNLNSKDKEFIVEFCKKLYISSNECFILVDSDDKNIYYEIDSLENNKIIKQKEPFYYITKMLEFLQSKME